ncbi:MAG: FecR domain-containing protein [Kiritimatiellae bacterium]|nr:FecR domain-containing protein [Kiritimatiellia bacterium]
MTDPSTLTELVWAQVDGRLDAPGRDRLARLLDESEEACRAYVSELRLHAALRVGLRASPAHETRPAAAPAQRARRVLPTRAARPLRPRFQPPREPSTRWARWFALAACLLVLAGGAYWYRHAVLQPSPGAEVRLESVRGLVVLHRGGSRLAAQAGAVLRTDDTIETGPAARAALACFGGAARVTLHPGTALAIRPGPPGGRTPLHLTRGTLTAAVTPQPAESAVVFHTPHAVATVLGTELLLSVDPERTRLEVTRGRVAFVQRGDAAAPVVVEAGRFAEVRGGRLFQGRLGRTPLVEPPRAAVPGLAAHWPFDEDGGILVRDASGNGHDGTLRGGVSRTHGLFGGALAFNEIDGLVVIPDFPYGPEFTIAFRYRMAHNAGPTYQYMLWHGRTERPNSVAIYTQEQHSPDTAGSLRTNLCDANDSKDPFALDVEPFVPDGQWHLYTLTVTPGVGSSVYLDGRLRRSCRQGGDPFDPAGDIFLGGRGDDHLPDRYYGGALDDVRIYNRALSAREIRQLAGR